MTTPLMVRFLIGWHIWIFLLAGVILWARGGSSRFTEDQLYARRESAARELRLPEPKVPLEAILDPVRRVGP